MGFWHATSPGAHDDSLFLAPGSDRRPRKRRHPAHAHSSLLRTADAASGDRFHELVILLKYLAIRVIMFAKLQIFSDFSDMKS